MAAYVNELLKFLVRAFHGPECGIVLDALLRANRWYSHSFYSRSINFLIQYNNI
jgi:hypothetical protein